ncbi:hypothetical protein QR98_0053970 [Sarcoptes scabiei]|uniref:Uncharacterized protein n=1 Tax=Sarcoptes scabiei TaxID=52283 RepID=A0A132A7F9_SARSC|nr:hypothetical protein QR98_0053970 [Sarcoptes scabiei]
MSNAKMWLEIDYGLRCSKWREEKEWNNLNDLMRPMIDDFDVDDDDDDDDVGDLITRKILFEFENSLKIFLESFEEK